MNEVAFDDLGPERVFYFYDSKTRTRAALVIDTTRFGLSAGGVRMAPDLTLREIARLARAMSYKFALLELPCGGAKAGIWLDPDAPERGRAIAAFLEAIRPLTEAGVYLPGADMGTRGADFAALYAGRGRRDLGGEVIDGLPLEDHLTGAGVVAAAKAACEWCRVQLAGMRVAIEGFGKVGTGAARYFAREEALVVAVSTVRGTLYDPRGLDVERLIELRREAGDGALELWAGRLLGLAPADLFLLPVDVLVPGARPDVLHPGNAASVRARFIVPAANIPYAPGTAVRLAARGVLALPDFATNAGGVLGGLAVMQGLAPGQALAMVRERIAANTLRVLAAARERQCTPCEAALALARRWIGLPENDAAGEV